MAERTRTARSLAAEVLFREQLRAAGATLLETEWLGSLQRHRAMCAQGHFCRPRPNDLQQGHCICLPCSGYDPRVAEAAFRERLVSLEITPLYEKWLGVDKGHRARCARGHDCNPVPGTVKTGCGGCLACAGQDPAVAESAFLSALRKMGATPLGPYRGSGSPVHVLCAAGHDWYPSPYNVVTGGGCRACSGRDPRYAEHGFRSRLAALGATPAYDQWLGVMSPHHVICRAGHDCWPWPNSVQQGQGICLACAGKRAWDTFYIVSNQDRLCVKFGISTAGGLTRLKSHRRDGYRHVVRLVSDLPGTVARDTESAVLSALRMAGEHPLQGREYFDSSCLALILDVAESWLHAWPEWLPRKAS